MYCHFCCSYSIWPNLLPPGRHPIAFPAVQVVGEVSFHLMHLAETIFTLPPGLKHVSANGGVSVFTWLLSSTPPHPLLLSYRPSTPAFHLLLMGNLLLSSVTLLHVGTNPFLPASVKAGCPFTSGSELWDVVELSVFLFLLLMFRLHALPGSGSLWVSCNLDIYCLLFLLPPPPPSSTFPPSCSLLFLPSSLPHSSFQPPPSIDLANGHCSRVPGLWETC